MMARTPSGIARYSVVSEPENSAEVLLASLKSDSNPSPPTPGADGYDPPNPRTSNPVSPSQLSEFVVKKPQYRLYCKSTRNNTIVTLTQPTGHPLAWFSGGSCGFKQSNRAGYEAGYQCAVRAFKKIQEITKATPIEVHLFFKGFGQGRDALHRALLTSEGDGVRPLVSAITDRTAIKIGGTRAKKMRRL